MEYVREFMIFFFFFCLPVADMQCDLGALWQPQRPVLPVLAWWCSRCFSLFAGVEKHIDELDVVLALFAVMVPAFVWGPPINAVMGKGGFLFIITVSQLNFVKRLRRAGFVIFQNQHKKTLRSKHIYVRQLQNINVIMIRQGKNP